MRAVSKKIIIQTHSSLFDLLSFQQREEDLAFSLLRTHPGIGISNPNNVKIVLPSHPNSKNGRKRRILWQRQKGLCAYCDVVLETPEHGTLDHIISRVRGGKTNMMNLALVCSPCNSLKSWFTSVKEVEDFTNRLLVFFKSLQSKGIVK